MNEQNTQTAEVNTATNPPNPSSGPTPPVQETNVKKESSALGITSLILASVAFMAPLLHWIVILSLSISSYETASESFGAGALGLLLVLVAEWILLPTVGLASLIIAIITLAKNKPGKNFALIALGINVLSVISIIAQIAYWSGIGS
jgi:hypothetical protein